MKRTTTKTGIAPSEKILASQGEFEPNFRFSKSAPKKQKKVSAGTEKRKSIIQLRKDCWRVFSKYIRLRDKYTCFTCGKDMNTCKEYAQAGHYVPQSKGNRLRFDERNVNCQCASCNMHQHGNLAVYALRLEEKYGLGILQEFNSIKNGVKKFERYELEEMIERYNGLVREYEVVTIAEECGL